MIITNITEKLVDHAHKTSTQYTCTHKYTTPSKHTLAAPPSPTQHTSHRPQVASAKYAQPFSISDIIRNPDLAQAARREMLDPESSHGWRSGGGTPSSADHHSRRCTAATDSGASAALLVGLHDLEIERQRHAVESINQDAVVGGASRLLGGWAVHVG